MPGSSSPSDAYRGRAFAQPGPSDSLSRSPFFPARNLTRRDHPTPRHLGRGITPHERATAPPRPAAAAAAPAPAGGRGWPGRAVPPLRRAFPGPRAASSRPLLRGGTTGRPQRLRSVPRPRRAQRRRRAELREPARGRGGCRGSGGLCGRREALPPPAARGQGTKAGSCWRLRVRPAWASWRGSGRLSESPARLSLRSRLDLGSDSCAPVAGRVVAGHCFVHGIRGRCDAFQVSLQREAPCVGISGLGPSPAELCELVVASALLCAAAAASPLALGILLLFAWQLLMQIAALCPCFTNTFPEPE